MTYTIVLHNGGSSASPDSATHELTDVLPLALTLVSATATSGTAVATPATNTVTWDGAIAAGHAGAPAWREGCGTKGTRRARSPSACAWMRAHTP